ncbi:F-box family protein [Euphorbia peplus]|nr:F-box family protein [Euphorbia peplus]
MDNISGADLCRLPEDCIATVISFTSPKDTGRLSMVSSGFKSASESDAVWQHFLPSDYRSLISQSSDPDLLDCNLSAKDLYLRLCDHPLLIDDGKKSFRLDKWSGKKSFMLSARDLMIVWGDTPRYWIWRHSVHKSRFTEVAELLGVCWLEIRGKIKASMLSPETHYIAYLVYKLNPGSYGFETDPVEVNVGISGCEGGASSSKRSLYLEAKRERRHREPILGRRASLFGHRHAMAMRLPFAQAMESDNDLNSVNNNNNGGHHHNRPKQRQDGWLEIELGNYFNREGEVGDLEISILEVNGGNWKGGLVVRGIDIRPESK